MGLDLAEACTTSGKRLRSGSAARIWTNTGSSRTNALHHAKNLSAGAAVLPSPCWMADNDASLCRQGTSSEERSRAVAFAFEKTLDVENGFEQRSENIGAGVVPPFSDNASITCADDFVPYQAIRYLWAESPSSTAVSASVLLSPDHSIASSSSSLKRSSGASVFRGHGPYLAFLPQDEPHTSPCASICGGSGGRDEPARLWSSWLRSRAQHTITAHLLRCCAKGAMPQALHVFQRSCCKTLRRKIRTKIDSWNPRMTTAIRTAIIETLLTSPYVRLESGYIDATWRTEPQLHAASPSNLLGPQRRSTNMSTVPIIHHEQDRRRRHRRQSPELALPQQTPSSQNSYVRTLQMHQEIQSSLMPRMPFAFALGSTEESLDQIGDSTNLAPFLHGYED
jgi:hypothetical protein